MAFKILELEAARPAVSAVTKLGMLPSLIAWNTPPIPNNKFSLTPKIFAAKANPNLLYQRDLIYH